MQKKLSIYLAGSIKKAHEHGGDSYWKERDLEILQENLPGVSLSFLNPAYRTDDLSDEKSIFGRDMLQVYLCDFMIADVRERRGLGVGAEMLWAKVHNTPLICWSPMNSHYRKEKTTLLDIEVENFVHPFVAGLADKVVENLEEASLWIKEVLNTPSIPIKGLKEIESCIEYYLETQHEQDIPMKELIKKNPYLNEKIAAL